MFHQMKKMRKEPVWRVELEARGMAVTPFVHMIGISGSRALPDSVAIRKLIENVVIAWFRIGAVLHPQGAQFHEIEGRWSEFAVIFTVRLVAIVAIRSWVYVDDSDGG